YPILLFFSVCCTFISAPLFVVPVFPLRVFVFYASMTLPLHVGRNKSIVAVKQPSYNYNKYS
ncbi:hypothetical protein, partial [Francisella tularensis]|uniref:hypothetical protein n=1 Tax=Francisella tularensis TaxID=263 RepID=UPI002381BF66